MRLFTGILAFLICSTLPGQSPVVVAPVEVQEISLGRRVVGTVLPIRVSTIGSALDGRVLTFDVNSGDRVEAGQRLAQLRPDTFKLQVAAARSQLELYRQQLAELANGSRPEDIAEAEAKMLAAKAASDNAAKKFERLNSLAESSAASDAELEDAREQTDAKRFTLMAAEATLKRVKQGPRLELIAQAEAQVELQLHQVQLLEDQLRKHTIQAPFDGFIAAEHTEVGAWISRGDPVVQVVQLDQVEVQLAVTAETVVHLNPGETIRVEFPELPQDLFVGTIERVVPVADPRSRTFPVFILLDNALVNGVPELKAGMLARVDVPAGRREAMPLVPKDALVLNGIESAVFVIDSDPKFSDRDSGLARRVPVTLGVAVGGLIQVSGNIKAGDWVATEGNERLLPGATVQVVGRRRSEIKALGDVE
ncbi:MAG: efflux RND transporter periplasmic adaptor subunit [Rubripirellula sp.]|nr:efflux RND transporter periplasmic adaptor subunit [Rubripirellula sp.]